MIAAIDPGFGLKEEKPILPMRPGGSKDFPRQLDKVLRKKHLPETSKNQKYGPSNESRADPRQRTQYGDRANTEKLARKENVASRDEQPAVRPESGVDDREGRDAMASGGVAAGAAQEEATAPSEAEARLNKAAQPPITPHLQDTFVLKPEEFGETEELAHANLSLTPVNPAEGEEFLTPGSRASAGTAFAMASYRMSPHGQNEVSAAALAGSPLPGTETLEAAPSTAKELAFQETVFQPAKQIAEGEALKSVDVISFSEVARQERLTETNLTPLERGLAKETAQSRDQLMAQLGFDTEAGPTEMTEAGEEVQSILRKGVGNHPLLDGVSLARTRRELSGLTQPVANREAKDLLIPVGALAAADEASGAEAKAILSKAGDQQVVAKDMIERIAREAKWMVNNRRTEMTMKLNPEHLGELNLKVVQNKDGVFRVEMIVDNLAAKQLLESNLAELRNRLTEDASAGQQFMFNVDLNNGHQPHPDMQAGRPEADARRMAAAPDALEQAAETSQAKTVYGDGRLSIYA